MLYYDKYLKYKNKYLQLKKQKGGLRRCELAINDIKLKNMIQRQSTAMVHVHGCIIGKQYEEASLRISNETFNKSTFTIPHNVNIITCTTLNKPIHHKTDKQCSLTSVSAITDFIKDGNKFFENNNMSNRLTNTCKNFFSEYIKNIFPEQNTNILDPSAPIQLRNHIYPSDMNESLLGPFETFHGIEIISNDRKFRTDIPKFRMYESMLGEEKDFSKNLLLSELLCYLFGARSLSETLKLPHLTIILHSCRSYCDKSLVEDAGFDDVDPDDQVFSNIADLDSDSFSRNGEYNNNDIVLITGTDLVINNSIIGRIIEKNILISRVTFKDLISKPELNGKIGFLILDKGVNHGRWGVTVSGQQDPISIHEKNLIFETRDKIECFQNNIFNIQRGQNIKLKNLKHPNLSFNNELASVAEVGPNSVMVISGSTRLKVDSSNIDMLPINVDSSKDLRKLKKVDDNFDYNKNYIYVVDGPNNFKIASSGKVIEFNLYNPNQITIKDSYSQILKNVTLDDIYEVV